MRSYWDRIWQSIERQDPDVGAPDSESRSASYSATIPTIWLLGKSGAGKSSLVKSLTGYSDIAIGNGFEPCTRKAHLYAFPANHPVLQFMDTRGIGEAGYDPADDLATYANKSQFVLAVAKLDDPAQGELCRAIQGIRKNISRKHIVVAHTGEDIIESSDRRQHFRKSNQSSIERAIGGRLRWFECDARTNADEAAVRERFLQLSEKFIPQQAASMKQREARTEEERQFSNVFGIVVRCSMEAALVTAMTPVPFVRIPIVFGIQAKMLKQLASRYEIGLSKDKLLSIGKSLGLGIASTSATGLLATEIGTFVPVYGQTAGRVVAGVGAFATTFAVGRASAHFFFHDSVGKSVDKAEIQRIYRSALKDAKSSFKARSYSRA